MSYVGDNKSYVGLTKSYVGDILLLRILILAPPCIGNALLIQNKKPRGFGTPREKMAMTT